MTSYDYRTKYKVLFTEMISNTGCWPVKNDFNQVNKSTCIWSKICWLWTLIVMVIPRGIFITVKPVLRGHRKDKEKVASWGRWPLKRGSFHIKCSMMGQEKVAFKYRWLLNWGDCMGRFDCLYSQYIVKYPGGRFTI